MVVNATNGTFNGIVARLGRPGSCWRMAVLAASSGRPGLTIPSAADME